MPDTSREEPEHYLGAWKAAWGNAAFRVQVIVTIPVLLAALVLFSHFLEWVETRPGDVLRDPIIASITAYDFTWPIFLFIYAGLVIGIVTLSAHPVQLVMAMQSYILMVCFRFAAMSLTPLDAPAGTIPLGDPIVQFFGTGEVLMKDLFFSGHTSTLLLLSLTATGRWLKAFFAFCTVAVGVMIVWQHAHYAIDVLVAPFISYTSYRLVRLFQGHIVQLGDNR
jgi:hypothetical protein